MPQLGRAAAGFRRCELVRELRGDRDDLRGARSLERARNTSSKLWPNSGPVRPSKLGDGSRRRGATRGYSENGSRRRRGATRGYSEGVWRFRAGLRDPVVAEPAARERQPSEPRMAI